VTRIRKKIKISQRSVGLAQCSRSRQKIKIKKGLRRGCKIRFRGKDFVASQLIHGVRHRVALRRERTWKKFHYL